MVKRNNLIFCTYILLTIIVFLSFLPAFPKNYYGQHSKGWHWYNDPILLTQDLEDSISNPVIKMHTIKKTLEYTLDNAILHPTPNNVKNYIILQNAMSNRASYFSHMWQNVLLQNPNLNYSLQHPTNQIGREVYLDETRVKEDAAIHKLAQHTGLFFFYRSTCPYCQRFAPILKDFSERYKISVVAITTDGISLPEFPNSRIDTGQADQFHVEVEPALFTVNPYTHEVIPVSYGLTTEDELRNRILEIANNFSEK